MNSQDAALDKITIWERFNEKRNQWEHNHIADGVADTDEPIAQSKEQKRSWSGARWRHKAGVRDADGLIHVTDD